MNYITIQNFMVDDLKLRGNELIIFALIYGFSQDGESDFHGSISYIQKRTGLSRQTVVDILKKLVEKKFITKEKKNINSIQSCIYMTSQETLLGVVKKLDWGSQEISMLGSQETRLNNKYIKEKEKNIVDDIIGYLNKKTHSNFKPNARNNRLNICGRIREGYTLDDFKRVIDIKTEEWLGTEMEKYLCPETLFRASKFEKYLNQKKGYQKKVPNNLNSESITDEIFGYNAD